MFRNPFPSSYVVGPRKEDVIRGWRKLLAKELHNLRSLAVIIAPKREERTLDWRKIVCVKKHFVSTCVHHYHHDEKVIYIYIYKISTRKSEGKILSLGVWFKYEDNIKNDLTERRARWWPHQFSPCLRPKSPSCRCDNKLWSLKIRQEQMSNFKLFKEDSAS
jgi:hypothetical protein